jgi:hypothetical protein
MQGWKHWLMGAGFFGFGTYKLFTDGSLWLVGLCVVASGYLFYRALTDQTGAAIEDLDLAVSFVRDPKGTLFDHAIDQLVGGDDEEPARNERKPGVLQSLVAEFDTREEKPAFDADAAIARYLANRPPPEAAPAPRAVQVFGRKRA